MADEQTTQKTDEEWRKLLTDEQYKVLRQCGTEPAFTGKYWDFHDKGTYLCAACGAELFSSDDKFDSGTGWPSYTKPAAEGTVVTEEDKSFGMMRTEVKCSRCGGHLGHVFDDGPKQMPDGRPASGKRFCVNSTALTFKKT